MTTSFAIKIILEVAAVMLLLVGIKYEDRLVALEDRIISSIRKAIRRNLPSGKAAAKKAAARRRAEVRAAEEYAARERRANSAAAARRAAARMDRRTPAEIYMDQLADHSSAA